MRKEHILKPEEVPVIDGSFLVPLMPSKYVVPPRTDPLDLLVELINENLRTPGFPQVLIQKIEYSKGLATTLGFHKYGIADIRIYEHKHFSREPRLRMSTEVINRYSAKPDPDHSTLIVYTPVDPIEEPVATFLRDWILRYVNAR